MKHQEIKGCGELILEEVLTRSASELSQKNPAVLSCGGIYIPPRKRQKANYLYHVLNTPNVAEPVKVVTGIPPRNLLYEVLLKESMN